MLDDITHMIDEGHAIIVISAQRDIPDLFEIRTNIGDADAMNDLLHNAALGGQSLHGGIPSNMARDA